MKYLSRLAIAAMALSATLEAQQQRPKDTTQLLAEQKARRTDKDTRADANAEAAIDKAASLDRVPGIGVQPQQDLGGWNGTKWGMTEAQIMAAFAPGMVVRPPQPRSFHLVPVTIMIKGYEILGQPFDVLFLMSAESSTLERVILEYAAPLLGLFIPLTFRDYEILLASKYGRPFYRDVAARGHLTSRWYSPSTVIELNGIWVPLGIKVSKEMAAQLPPPSFTISYSRNRDKDKI